MSTGRHALAPACAVVTGGDGRQGSGVLVDPTALLTCAHVVGGDDTARVAFPGGTERLDWPVLWSDARLDVALLQAPPRSGSALPAHMTRLDGAVRLGMVSTEHPVADCLILGFPRIQRYDGNRLDLDQYTGTVLPLAGLVRRTMVLEFDRPPAAERTDGTSPLAGLSGAPVFAGGTLIGIVRSVPRGRDHRRVECAPLSEVLGRARFRTAFHQATLLSGPLPRLERITHPRPDDSRYEEEYADALGAAHRKTRIFGLDDLAHAEAEWDLDTAYLSLAAEPKDGPAPAGGPAPEPGADTVPQRVETLLASRRRVLLRGAAGAGKTTLLSWLAAHASAGTLDSRLGVLNGKVPFVVPLRTLRARAGGAESSAALHSAPPPIRFPAPDELSGVSALQVGAAPGGWASRVLTDGRALLLVDGLDEIPEADREDAHGWLAQLLRRFPGTRCVVTVRPLAVAPDWLRSEGFEELSLLRMDGEDIAAFTAAWHDAARLEDRDHRTLDELERNLTGEFARTPALRSLAGTPLLCAVICALHRKNAGLLPKTRWELYRSALNMLLGQRDQRRRASAPEGIRLDAGEQEELLQRIAAWLVRNGLAEFGRQDALRRIEDALAGMPRVREQGSADRVLTHLLNRSGLLQERSEGVYQFAHRTFQDFLAAKEFIDGGGVRELVRNAAEPQWQDVVQLAAGHCTRRDLPELVTGLLEAGGRAKPERGAGRSGLLVLAALCAQHGVWLDSDVHDRVRRAVRGLLPPGTLPEMEALVPLGSAVVELLPEAGTLTERQRVNTIELVSRLGGPKAVSYIGRLARSRAIDSSLRHALSRDWHRFPAEAYATEVLAHLDLGLTALTVVNPERAALLPRLPHARHLHFATDLGAGELAAALAKGRCETVELHDNRLLTDLTGLRPCGERLRALTISGCPRLESYTGITELTALERLSLSATPARPADLELIASRFRLRTLAIDGPWPREPLDLTPFHSVPGLRISVEKVPPDQIIGAGELGSRLTLHP
ncbi:NACHT domain-containing protein [Streptomyces sp. CAU 1734]|uniref:NACHT domain-containing protein n=1 Tax=Streptomyces sp. CAU 1734 TaxID=3140360 RepID=UPI003260F225